MRKNIGSQQPDRALTCGDAKVRFHEKSAPVIKKDRVGSSLVRYFEVASTSHSVFSNSWRGDKSMQRYDPLVAPDPEEWLALDEQERIDLARDYHHNARTHYRTPRCTRSSRRKSRSKTERPHGAAPHGCGSRPA